MSDGSDTPPGPSPEGGNMTDLLKSIPYWDDLTEEEKERVAAAAYVRHYETGTQIYGPCVECVGINSR